MTASWLDDLKLTPPAAPADRLTRSWPVLAAPPTLLAIAGGPGTGKTLALLAYAEAREAAGGLVVWYGLEADDAEPAAFFPRLVAGVRRQIPGFGDATLAAAAQGGADARRLWAGFFGELAAYAPPALAICLDDAQTLEGGLAALLLLVPRLPAGVTVAIAGRRLPPMDRLVADGVAAQLGPDDLRFADDDATRWLTARAGGELPAAWRARLPALEGWPLGLAMLAAGGGPGDARGDALARYVGDELFQVQPPQRRAFMVRAGLLPALTPAALAAVVGDPAAHEHVGALAADHLLRPADEGRAHRFPGYLRDFLQAEAPRAMPTDELVEVHRRAARWLLEQGEAEAALGHLIAAGDWAGALREAEAPLAALDAAGRHADLARWLGRFPAAVRADAGAIARWEGRLHEVAGRLAEAATAFDRARTLAAEKGDDADELAAAVRQARLAARTGDQQRFNRLALMVQARAAEARPADLAELHLARALVAERRGDPALARECGEAVLALGAVQPTDAGFGQPGATPGSTLRPAADTARTRATSDGGTRRPAAAVDAVRTRSAPLVSDALAAAQVDARLILASASLAEGDVEAALRQAAFARVAAQARGLAPRAVHAAHVEARALLARGEPAAAAAALDDLPPEAPQLLFGPAAPHAALTRGGLAMAQERWDEAETELREALAAYEAEGDPVGRAATIEATLWLALRRNQFARVAALFQAAGVAADPGDWGAAEAPLALPRARAKHLAGDPAAALAVLAVAAPALERLGLRLGLARLRAFEAAALVDQGDRVAARASLARAEALAAEAGWDFLPALDPTVWGAIALLKAANLVTTTQDVPKPRPKPTGQPPLETLVLQAFGRFEVRIDDRLVDRWPRRKAKLVLAVLALRGRVVSGFDLAELLGDGDPTSGHGTLSVTIPALRRALEPDLGRGTGSRFIRTVDDGYALTEEAVQATDLRRFEQAIARAGSRRQSAPAEAAAAYEAALALYRGDLFDEPLLDAAFEPERVAYRGQALSAALWLADHHAAIGDAPAIEAALNRAIAIAPTDEEPYLRFMRHHKGAGRADRVSQIYWDCRKTLKHRAGITPGEAFESAYKTMR